MTQRTAGLLISIPAKRDWAVLFLFLWLAFWTFAGLHSWRSRITAFGPFTVIWLSAELWASYLVLDTLGGKEIILANSEGLTRTKKIFGIGGSTSYVVSDIRNLRFQRGLGRQPSRIAFDYRGKTISFGKYLDEAEAVMLLSRIRQQCSIFDCES